MTQLSQLVRRAVQTSPSGLATVFDGRSRTWQAFEDRTKRLAGGLHGLGFGPGDRIGILALNSDRYLECLFGLSLGGFVFVPINTRLAPPEIVFWLVDSECVALFVDDAFLPVLPKLLPETPSLRQVIYLGDGKTPPDMPAHDRLIAGAEAWPESIGSDDDLVGIFYTGGTTGRSKGVMLSHNNITANVYNTFPGALVDEDSRYIHAAPMFHLADNAMTFLVAGFAGTHYFLPRFDPAELIRAVAEHRSAIC
jgi:long-chain acyl-CoA synthetase